jgi:GntR family transcriptional regulator, rspAB operon transcriptional repressor
MDLARIKNQRASDEVYESLRQAILTHVFLPGQRLQIQDIAAKLGVSLTPVRQAIQRLSTEGLIEVQPRSGTYVASLSATDIEETFDIRCALECLAAEKAVERITDEELRHLRELLVALQKPAQEEEAIRQHEADNYEFHATLLRAAGNRRLMDMVESLKANIQMTRVHQVEGYRGDRFAQEQIEHEAIYRALEARDSAALQTALRRHILRAKESLIAGIREKRSIAAG